jgi:hypothetical protein
MLFSFSRSFGLRSGGNICYLINYMTYWRFRSIRFQTAIVAAFCLATALAEASSLPSAEELVKKAVDRAAQAQAKSTQPAYTYTKLTVTEELDASGNVKEREQKVYNVVFQSGASYLKLIEVNGHAPAEADRKKQAEKELNLNKLTGDRKSGKASPADNILTPELVARYDFTVITKESINGRQAYKLKFHPKSPELPVRHIVDRLLNRISGTVWIDAEEYEVARANIFLGSEINLLGGVIGSLKHLAYTVTRTRMSDGLWFNTSSSGDFEGRKLLDSTRIKTKSQSTNFRPFG